VLLWLIYISLDARVKTREVNERISIVLKQLIELETYVPMPSLLRSRQIQIKSGIYA
jgi:hypothetical protein